MNELKREELYFIDHKNGSVSILYPDGDECGVLHDNMGLEITARFVVELLGIKEVTI